MYLILRTNLYDMIGNIVDWTQRPCKIGASRPAFQFVFHVAKHRTHPRMGVEVYKPKAEDKWIAGLMNPNYKIFIEVFALPPFHGRSLFSNYI